MLLLLRLTAQNCQHTFFYLPMKCYPDITKPTTIEVGAYASVAKSKNEFVCINDKASALSTVTSDDGKSRNTSTSINHDRSNCSSVFYCCIFIAEVKVDSEHITEKASYFLIIHVMMVRL